MAGNMDPPRTNSVVAGSFCCTNMKDLRSGKNIRGVIAFAWATPWCELDAWSGRLICGERSKRSHPDPSHATVPR